jgi:hypothetical protein
MNQLTMDDVVNHIEGCGYCEHLKRTDGKYEFSKEIYQKAVVAAHSKKEAPV